MSMKPSAVPTMAQPYIPVDQGIYEESTTAKAPVGTRLEVGDRTFYYAQAGTNLTAGMVACAPAPIAGQAALAGVATSAGVKEIQVTNTATVAAVNAYAEGTLIIATGDGAGAVHRIVSNGTMAATADSTVVLYDEIQTALTATSLCHMLKNPYKGVIIGLSTAGMPVVVAPVAVTSGNYFWGQTYGYGAPLNQVNTPAAAAVKLGTGAQVLQAFNGGTTAAVAEAYVIGKNLGTVGTTGGNTPTFIDIRP